MATRKSAAPASVDAFLATLAPDQRALVDALRQTVLAADPRIAEGIKWNVPSFRTSEFFATLNPRVKTGVGLILHFGARKNAIAETGVAIADPSGLLRWLAKDRAAVEFRDAGELAEQRAAFTRLVREWVRHL